MSNLQSVSQSQTHSIPDHSTVLPPKSHYNKHPCSPTPLLSSVSKWKLLTQFKTLLPFTHRIFPLSAFSRLYVIHTVHVLYSIYYPTNACHNTTYMIHINSCMFWHQCAIIRQLERFTVTY